MKASLIIRNGVTAALILLVGTACTNQAKPVSNPGKSTADIFSNRPIGVVPELFIVTLQSPALLAVAKRTPAGWEIPEDAKKEVLAEQALFEQKLKSIAPQAQVVYKYRLVLNGLAVYAPADLIPSISAVAGVTNVNPVRQMARPEAADVIQSPRLTSSTTSVTFIGADVAHQLGITGKGMKVGVLDTGVDFTHSMLGGSGKAEDYKAIDPNGATPMFPNAKVVGGLDLVGTDFNAASPLPKNHLPQPDGNPLDEAGHGTHVAGTIAGIGDGKKTYSGVAPEAVIHAIKVFGKDGSTMDSVVIAGFEYAADPNGDMDLSDRLDVINLSLGGGFGQPQILYTEASKNLSRAGTVIVASAGNSGPVDYIVGAPSTADDAFSIAASIDGMVHNWQYPAVRFTNSASTTWLSKAVEGTLSKPIDDIGPTEGELYSIGLADVDLTPEQKAELQGKVAIIMRGKVPFAEKIRRAFEAGAIGAVVVNNEPGNRANPMGGEGHYEIPAVMIGNDTGVKILTDMKAGPVKIQFKTPDKIYEPENIDTITDFSSKGPRSEDNLLKPEIAAPGSAIISAAMGGGTAGVGMSGTSMAAPHMSGVMALLRQARPDLTAAELKALAMGTAKVLPSIPMTLQGAGRVQVDKAIKGQLIVSPAALSLGRVQVGTSRKVSRPVTLKNISNQELSLNVQVVTSPGLRIVAPSAVTIPAGSEVTIQIEAEVSVGNLQEFSAALEGRLFFTSGNAVVAHLPALAIATQASMIQGQAPGATKLTLTNSSPLSGLAVAFNLLGEDPRKAHSSPSEAWKSRSCDLQSVGYRIVTQDSPKGGTEEVLQVAFKLYTPMTTWMQCEVSALIDSNGDGIAEQELAGTFGGSVEGFAQPVFASLLLDATKARTTRLAYEVELNAGKQDAKVDYGSAIIAASGMAPFPHSTIAVIEAPLALIAKAPDGSISLKAAALGGGGDMVEADDYLGNALGGWLKLAGKAEDQAYSEIPEVLQLPGGQQQTLTYKRGKGSEKLVIYYPNNELLLNGVDNQSQVF